jgi:hypothetical protein
VIEPTTREKYTYYLRAHVMPEFGPMKMTDILPEHVREWITKMQAKGASASNSRPCPPPCPARGYTPRTSFMSGGWRLWPTLSNCWSPRS